jgi:hypothetical protein
MQWQNTMNKLIALAALCSSLLLSANETKIELVANFAVDTESLNLALASHHMPAQVEISDLSHYGEPLKKVKSRWINFLRKFSIDLAPQVPVSEDLSKIVFWNITHRYTHRHELWRLPKEKMVLFMWEPPTVLPHMYSPEVARCFSKIYTWNDALVDNQTYFKFYYPVLTPQIEEIPSFEEKKLCTLVSTNLTSPHPNELYSEREKAITYFENAQENGFEFYGRQWDAQTHPSYRGTTENKIDTIKNYRFSICYENIHTIDGYVTEKIFDCFAAGNVPIYWGASNIDTYIPKNCFIDRHAFKDLSDLHTFLKNMTQEEYEGYLTHIRAFLLSDAAQLFSWKHFHEIFCEATANK